MLFMQTPKQHFDSEDGDFKVPWIKARKGPWKCQPIKGVTQNPDGTLSAEEGNAVAQYVAAGSWRNQLASEVLGEYGVPLIPIYNSTVTAWEFHRSNHVGQECSHFCHPSLPQFWLWHLLKVLRQVQLPLVQDPSKQKLQAGCAITYDRDEPRFGAPRPTASMLAEQERQQGFWDWLFGRKRFVLRDGLLMPATDAEDAAVLESSSDTRAQRGIPWAGVQQLLELLQQQQQRQGQGRTQAGFELLQAEGALEEQQEAAEGGSPRRRSRRRAAGGD
jgi:hypothetical protein